ncbi:membrane-spanning 4-domains subfamily A member 4D-like isoform X2 [Trachinotus anak]|uniref:membrane-spanning 4-domains subfamily A member 4D-like isoform X2 n=1 Tax=Trachinotus anak TaxID=443729 RepID=UPI0039F18771
MSVTVVKDKGVTVVTVASDRKSMFPPLCQILKHLCYSPTCCSEYKGLMQINVTAALGAMQIMVGLFNIGLGPGRTSTHPGDLTDLGAAYWLGAVYIAAGIMSVVAGQCPSLCLVGLAVLLNIVGSIFAVIGIVLYAIDLADASLLWMCDQSWNRHFADNYGDNCRFVAFFAQKLLTGMDITLIVLAVLQLCVCISFAVLGIKALVNRKKEEGGRDVEIYQAVLKEVLMTSPGA